MRAVSVIAKTLIAAVFLTAGCGRAPKREGDLEAVRVEILAIEKQWASAIERQDAAHLNGSLPRTSGLSRRMVAC
jgi:hypothetical protein